MNAARSRKGRLAAGAAAAAFVATWLIWSQPSADSSAPVQASAPAVPPTSPTQHPASSPATAGSAAVADDTPPGLSRDQWTALRAETLARADGPAELQRLSAYLGWSDTLRRFREARRGADALAARALAERVDQGLEARLRESEISAAEARQIKSAVLEVTQPDEAVRAEQLQQWATATFTTTTPDPRQAAFAQRQSAIVAAWSGLPAAERDRAALERQLDALRRQSFSSAAR